MHFKRRDALNTPKMHSSFYVHLRTRKALEKIKLRVGVGSTSLVIRAAVAVLDEMADDQVLEWIESVQSWRSR